MQPPKKEEGGLPEWMATYGDMVTLLLTFFIMLFSMATIDKAKYEALANALRGQFNVYSEDYSPTSEGQGNALEPGDLAGLPVPSNTATPKPTPESTEPAGAAPAENPDIEAFLEKIQELILEYDLGEYVSVLDNGPTITLRVNSIVLFDSGKADIKPVGQNVLKNLGGILHVLDRYVIVQGHTDNKPINTSQFPSNWELSTRRATNVLQYFLASSDMDPKKLSAAGYGEHQPIADNDTGDGRTQNRRIDIVIVK